MDLKTIVRILSALLTCVLVEELLPKWEKKWQTEAQTEEEYCTQNRRVRLKRKTAMILRGSVGLLCVINLALLVFPRISEWLHLPYIPAMIGLTAVLLLCMGVLFFAFGELEYTDTHFTYTNAFGFSRHFYYADLLEVTAGRHTKLVTKTKKLLLPAGFAGTAAFLHYVEEKRMPCPTVTAEKTV